MTHTPNTPPTDTPAPPKRRGWRWLRHTLRVVIYLPLLLLILIALLIGTPFGSRISVMLANSLVPDLEVEYHSGHLNQELTLTHANWQMSGIQVATQMLSLNWDPLCLLSRQVCVNNLSAGAITVDIDTDNIPSNSTYQAPTPAPADALFILPLSINLNASTLNQVKVRVNDMHFTTHRLELSALWPSNILNVNRLIADGLEVIIPSATDANSSSPSQAAAVTSPWPLANLPKIFNPVAVNVDDLSIHNAKLQLGDRQDVFSQIELIGSFRGSRLNVDKLDVHHTYGHTSLNGHMDFSGRWPLNYQATLTTEPHSLLPEMPSLQADLSIEGDFSQLNTAVTVAGKLAAELTGTINLQQPSLPFTAHGQRINLYWPFDAPLYRVTDGAIQASGTLLQQLASVSGFIDSPYSQKLAFAANVNHHDQRLQVNQLSLLQDNTSVHVSGRLDYQDAVRWDASLAIDELDPARLSLPLDTPLPQGNLSLSVDTTGKYTADMWQVSLNNTKIEGTLNQEVVSAAGDLAVNSNYFVTADNFSLKALDSELTLDGKLAEQWRLNAVVDIPDISNWTKEAQGNLHINVVLAGSDAEPTLAATATLKDGQYLSDTLKQLSLSLSADLKQLQQYSLFIDAEQANIANVKVTQVSLHSQGNIQQQATRFLLRGPAEIDSEISSQFDKTTQDITGQMTQLNASTPLGKWQLDNPVNVHWSQTKLFGTFSPLCLKQADNQFCLSTETGVGRQGDAQLSFSGTPGQVIAPLLPPGLHWQGLARMAADAKWSATTKPTAQLVVQLPEGQLIISRQNEPNVEVPYQNVELYSQLNEHFLSATLSAKAGKQMTVDSAIKIAVTPDRSLTGHIDINHGNLSTWLPFIPQLAVLSGKVASSIEIGGSLPQPLITGDLTITDGAIASNANPTLINNLDFNANFERQMVNTRATWQMGKGAGKLDGTVDWSSGSPLGLVNITGEKLDVIAPPLAILQVSPQLTLEVNPTNIYLKGKVIIPTGEITIVQLAAGGIPLSSDVVFYDSTSALQQQATPFPFSTDLIIQVDPAVRIQGLGLKGNLSGNLNLQQQINRPPFLFGEVKVLNGTYRFLGQTLQISVGDLQFAGPPDVPNLNIEAVKVIKAEDVTAGVRITGTAKKPVVTLFSNPPKEQAEILSYIIKGSGFSATDSGNDALMMGAALALGNQLGGGAISEIGNTASSLIEKFGFNNVQLDTNDDGQVAISGYIGERLMVKYGIGVFNPGYELTVRYYLLSRLYLETVSGTLGQSLDIYYSFDF
ncbi:translocation/assembly module TamB domain-containing protein [Shewanella sp. NIFS-20-20]|uniref:autotransporter assembly complex protein TamB n=1 Tax=Shewanella sp. NIFS-20-20 TaxID=2853806 RepID=UPI001C47424F|nr:translocation/assembly module TamB domain-containing protein [Shewanella sp. NIFS-20-20]MBV7315091.1 translocation/assembly module TamB domain-containing protein [Shewanella sp. NIFS-20-20]